MSSRYRLQIRRDCRKTRMTQNLNSQEPECARNETFGQEALKKGSHHSETFINVFLGIEKLPESF